ncbi:hypothetical protein Dimus_021893 [Dionaea muscipula]
MNRYSNPSFNPAIFQFSSPFFFFLAKNMLPFYPHVPSRVNSQAPTGFLPQQDTGNPNHFIPNMTQLHSQVGYMSPQVPAPFTCPNPNTASVNMANPLQGLMNVSNQNGHMGKSILGMAPPMMHHVQSHVGFLPPNLNTVTGFPVNGQFGGFGGNLNGLNPPQFSGQLLAQGNAVNSLNQNFRFQNGQLGWQNQLPNVPGQFVNPAPAAPFGPMMSCANQVAQGMLPQTNAFVASLQSGLMQTGGALQQNNLSPHNLVPCMMDVNASRQVDVNANQVAQGMLPQTNAFVASLQTGLMQTGHALQQNNLSPHNLVPCMMDVNASRQVNVNANQVAQGMLQTNAFVASLQSGVMQTGRALQQNYLSPHNVVPCMMDVNASRQQPAPSQQTQMKFPSPSISASPMTQQNTTTSFLGDSCKKDGMLIAASGNRQTEKFRTNPKREASDRFHKSQNHHLYNGRGNQMFSNQNGVKGVGNSYDRGRKTELDDSANQSKCGKRRSLVTSYTDKEIRQWREERKKHYPTKTNIEKKRKDRQMNSEAMEIDAKLRRQQLKDVLAKQVELGFEVPEIPPHYLTDSEERRPLNKFQKRDKSKHQRWSTKRQRRVRVKNYKDDDDSFSTLRRLREPTLLQKLLSADIKRDKSRLLQALRFMVVNSFFKDWPPQNPLKFPRVIVNEVGYEAEAGAGAEMIDSSTPPPQKEAASFNNSQGDDGGCSYDNETDHPVPVYRNSNPRLEVEEEEGEITD